MELQHWIFVAKSCNCDLINMEDTEIRKTEHKMVYTFTLSIQEECVQDTDQ